MFIRKKSVVDWLNFATVDLFHVAAFQYPILSQGRQALNRVERHARIAPRTAGVVNADRFVYFDLAGNRLRRREIYFAERHADVGMDLPGDENLAGIRQLIRG